MAVAFLPLTQAQDSRLLKSAEPNYAKYSPELTADFDTVTASVTLIVQANGKPFSLVGSNMPLPMAVVMALKDYAFQPQGSVSPCPFATGGVVRTQGRGADPQE